MLRLVAIALLAQLSGGGSGPLQVRVVSWNLQGAVETDRQLGQASRLGELGPDFAALQECVDCEPVIPREHTLAGEIDSGVGLSYHAGRWQLHAAGALMLGDNDDGWGPRVARWGRFEHRETGRDVLVYSTHWCVPVRSSVDACTAEAQVGYARSIAAHARLLGIRAVVIAGDLNVFDGFDAAPALRYLQGAVGYEQGAASKAATFAGNDFAAAGRIDYILARGAQIRSTTALSIEPLLSDHARVVAELELSRDP